MTIKQRLRTEELNKEAGKWLQCYERVERCNGDCEHCKYDQDLSMFHFLSGYKRLLEEIINGEDSKRIKAN